MSVVGNFKEACRTNNLDEVKRCLELPDFKYEWINDGLYCACFWGCLKVAEYLLPSVDNININWLKHCYPMVDQQYKETEYLTIIQMLLDHGGLGNFNLKDITFIQNGESFYLERSDFKQKAKTLITEYLYRIDGPIYNQNVIG